jgi:hypothetical protein
MMNTSFGAILYEEKLCRVGYTDNVVGVVAAASLIYECL